MLRTPIHSHRIWLFVFGAASFACSEHEGAASGVAGQAGASVGGSVIGSGGVSASAGQAMDAGNGGVAAGSGGAAASGSGAGGSMAGSSAAGTANGGGSAGSGGGGGASSQACDPSDRLPAPTAVNVSFKGAAFTGPHQVAVETDGGLSGATIFRPKELKAGDRFPIVAWAQGGCAMNGLANPEFNAEIASHGYLMISDGAPGGSQNRAQSNDYRNMGVPLVKYLDWAIAENERPCSQYYQRLDPTKLAVFGWSCGGLMAEGASNDPRITTFMINSSGMINYDQKIVDGMHTPALILLGGASDIAYANGMNDYAKITKVPVVVASTNVGHGGTYQDDNGGSFAKVDLAWLNWWLKGDEGVTGKGLFLGAGCGLCMDAKWTIQSKNFAP